MKLKPRTVYKWAQEGQIPAAKLGKEWRFRKGILDEWIDSQIMQSKTGEEMARQRMAEAAKGERPTANIESIDLEHQS